MNGKKQIVGYPALSEFLTGEGFPIAESTVAKLCSPAIAQGPALEGYWQNQRTFDPGVVLAWAKSRIRPAEDVRKAAIVPADTTSNAPPRRPRGRPRKTAPAAVPPDSPPVAPAESTPGGDQ